MPNPMKVFVKNQGPKWLKALDKYIEKPRSDEVNRRDAKAEKRNHGGDRQDIDDATYVDKGRR